MPETRNQEHIDYRLNKLENEMKETRETFYNKMEKINDSLYNLGAKVTAMVMLWGLATLLLGFLLYRVYGLKQ